VSLDGFHRGLAAMVADPELVLRARRGDLGWAPRDLTGLERTRLAAMACDDRREALCSIYRSNRLTALVRTVPALVDALGPRLGPHAARFRAHHPRTDLQFRSEGAAFCRSTRERHPDDAALVAAADQAEADLVARYGGD